MERLVLDTSVLLSGRDPPRGPRWLTTPEAAAEVSPGGRDASRFALWQETGLEVRSPRAGAVARVEDAARRAGSLDRLSRADVSLLGLALDEGATLMTDDHTMLDVAARLGVATVSLGPGIRSTLDWHPRCSGCGRWFEEAPRRGDCPVCGSPVRARPQGRRT